MSDSDDVRFVKMRLSGVMVPFRYRGIAYHVYTIQYLNGVSVRVGEDGSGWCRSVRAQVRVRSSAFTCVGVAPASSRSFFFRGTLRFCDIAFFRLSGWVSVFVVCVHIGKSSSATMQVQDFFGTS